MRARHLVASVLAAATISTIVVPLTSSAATRAGRSIVITAPFRAHGSIDGAWVTGATPGASVSITGPSGTVVASGTADRLGSYEARGLTPGAGYTLRTTTGGHSASVTLTVLSTTPPPASLDNQSLHVGLNYLTMRDGVTLAATVRLPPGKTLANGPFPTVIEYSGYGTAGPASLIDSLTGKPVANPGLLPDSATVVGGFLAPELGFAVVSLQMRGTGCSGGAYDLFGLDSDYDGYDAVQITAHQPWVLGHKVGMVGISYSGISQFEVAGTLPPALAAIAPMSPTDDLYSTGYPGGIYNDGFAASWVAERESDALPADVGGQGWAKAEIATGDTTCLQNQALHLQSQDLNSLIGPNLDRDPALFDQRSPSVWASHLKIPVFVVGSLQDEQTGPQWVNLLGALSGDKSVFATIDNGLHIDSLGPATISRWLEFLELYVAGRTTASPATKSAYGALKLLAPLLYASSTGTTSMAVPALRFTSDTSLAAAKAAFVAQDPRVRVLYNNGASSAGPGAMGPVAEQDFTAWPPPQGTVTKLYLGAGGSLGTSTPSAATTSFRPDPAARPVTDLPSGNPWYAAPPYDWTPVSGSTGAGFVTAPFPTQTTIDGWAALDLSLSSTAPDTDLQATVTEVRPDGREEFVASGVLRASDRALSSASTALHPVPLYRTASAAPLPSGVASMVDIPIDPIAHVFPAGTRLRVVLSAPGGDRAAWAFATPSTNGNVTDTITLGGATASALVIDEVPNSTVLPEAACGALRGEPCRSYVPAGNGG